MADFNIKNLSKEELLNVLDSIRNELNKRDNEEFNNLKNKLLSVLFEIKEKFPEGKVFLDCNYFCTGGYEYLPDYINIIDYIDELEIYRIYK